MTLVKVLRCDTQTTVLSNTAATYWVPAMWLDGFEMCCKYKIYTGFRKYSMNKEIKSISFINKKCRLHVDKLLYWILLGLNKN